MSFSKFIWSAIGKKVVMALTGGCLAVFLLIHLVGNSTSFWGAAAFTAYAARLHSLGPLVPIFETGLLLIFLTHVIFAGFLYFDNLAARPRRYYRQNNAGGRTWGSRTMPYTGLVILLFVVLHLLAFRGTDPAVIATVVRGNLRNPLTALYYIASLIALIIHLSHGLWSMLQSLGLQGEKFVSLSRYAAGAVSVTGGIIFIAIPVLIMFYPAFLK
ncbi:MAG: succinate dehydrogenase cytochrome b subunit [Deltaproteobacteria bacterium]|nr:succinate dehydrogenase cytochrome b subunit [Deltaproteobacteria bacterium]